MQTLGKAIEVDSDLVRWPSYLIRWPCGGGVCLGTFVVILVAGQLVRRIKRRA